jgi:hypothetical protein
VTISASDPTRPDSILQVRWCAAQKPGEGRTQGTGGVKACIVPGRDDLAAICQPCEPFAQTALARHVQKRHPEMPPEAAPDRRRIMAALSKMRF